MKYIYQVRMGDDNEELRYSLRSLEKNAPEGEVVIGGYMPNWINPKAVTYVAVPQAPNKTFKGRNAATILKRVLEVIDHHERWVMMNDDFFILRPVETFAPLHNGNLYEAAKRSRQVASGQMENDLGEPIRVPGIGYVQEFPHADTMDYAAALLEARGYKNPLNYGIHVPLPVDPALLQIADKWIDDNYPSYRAGVGNNHRWTARWKAIYGNMFQIGGEQIEDVKIYDRDTSIPRGSDFVSTVDSAFQDGSKVKRSITRRFSSPSKFEKR